MYTTKINSIPWSSKSENTLFRISMQSTIPLVLTFSQFDSIQSDLISVFPVTRPLRFVHRELGLGHYGEILTRTFRILHLQRLHAKAIYPTSTIYKSVNLQYNTLGRLDDGTNESSTKRLMFQVLCFFSWFLAKFFAKILSIYFPTIYKSVNLQYNTLGCLDDGTNESSTKCLTF